VVTVAGRAVDRSGASPLENSTFLEDLLRALRREDIKGRFSNDRLAFLLVETERDVAEQVTKRIHARFNAIQDSESGDLEYGLGLASFPADGENPTDLLRAAEVDARANPIALTPARSRLSPRRSASNGSRLPPPSAPRPRRPDLGGGA
jgi:hypothetical protein